MSKPNKEDWTVAELVAELSKHPPDAPVRVKAACCGHLHEFAVRTATDDENERAETNGYFAHEGWAESIILESS